MNLRELKIKDASLMLKWMHDETVVRDLQTNFYKKNIQDCVCFIQNSLIDDKNLHQNADKTTSGKQWKKLIPTQT